MIIASMTRATIAGSIFWKPQKDAAERRCRKTLQQDAAEDSVLAKGIEQLIDSSQESVLGPPDGVK